jgi:outer membrane protein assembly factor BamB
MPRRRGPFVIFVVLSLAATGLARAQGRGGASWTTSNGDAQRTSWVKTDPKISKASMQKPGFQFLWKMKLDNQAKQLNSLTQPLLLPNIISYKGFKALAFVGGSSDNVYSIDSDLNKLFWKTHLNTASSSPPPTGSLSCPGGLTAITRFTPLPPPAPAPGAPPAGRGGGGGRGGNQNVFAISSDGMAHALNPQTGEDVTPPITFLPPNAKAVGAVLIDTILYAATADNCGGAPNGVWAVDLASNPKVPVYWESKGGGVAGTASPTFGTDGTVYAAIGDGEYSASSYSDAVVSLEPKTLTLKDWFTPGKTAFTASLVVFQFKGKDVIVAANADGRLYVLDSASLGGTDHRTPLYRTAPYTKAFADFTAGALSTWQDADGTRWVLAASGGPIAADTTFPMTNGRVANGSIVAFKVVEQNGTPALEPGWVSRDMVSPLPPAIVNGVVFAVSSGEYRTADASMSAARRAQRSKSAVLYALDASTGTELWNSGNTITSFVHAIGPSAGDSQVYVVTYDGTVYAFGIPLEH